MIVCFALQADTDGSSLKRAALTVESVRKHLPEAKIIQMANEDFPEVSGVDEVVRRKNDGDFIRWAFESIIGLADRGENILQIATDVVLCADVSDVFDSTFDIASCRYPAHDRDDGAFCGDVNFIKPSGLAFWKASLGYYNNHPEIQDGWEGGQTAFLEISKTFAVKELDYETYCWTPDKPRMIPSHAKIAHFRGNRKLFMESVCRIKYPTVFVCTEDSEILRDMVSRNLSHYFPYEFIVANDAGALTFLEEKRVISLHPDVCIVSGLDDLVRYEGYAVSKDRSVRVWTGDKIGKLPQPLEQVLPRQIVAYSATEQDIPKDAKIVSFKESAYKPAEIKGNWVEHIYKVGGGSSLELDIVGNCTDEFLTNNIKASLTLPHPILDAGIKAHNNMLCIVGGGPSLAESIEDIRRKQKSGAAIWALNNSFKYLRDNGIEPNAHIMLDAREKNAAFVPENSPATLFYSASCHPNVFEAASHAGGKIIVWYPAIAGITDLLANRKAILIATGNSVGLKAMGLAMVMGFLDVHLYGFDSSYRGDENHAYKQPLNDSERVIDVQVNGRKFKTAAWMAMQAEEFKQISKDLCENHGMAFTVHGDGLLPYVASLMAA